MGAPSWLYYLFGVLMLAVAAYCFVLLVLSVTSRPVGRVGTSTSAHISWASPWPACSCRPGHSVRAASGSWSSPSLLVWFVVRSVQSIQRFGLHVPHALIHAA